MATEQKLQADIRKCIEKEFNGYVIITIKCSKSGVHDIIACVQGKFFSFEAKRPGHESELSPLQAHNMKLVINSGGVSACVSYVEEVRLIIHSYTQQKEDADL